MSMSMPSLFSSSMLLVLLLLCQLQPALTYVNPPDSPHQFQTHRVAVHRSTRTFVDVTSSSPNVSTAATTVDSATTATTTRHHRQLLREQRKTKAQPNSLVPTASPTKAMKKGKQNEYQTASPIKATKKGKQKEYPMASPTKGKHNEYPTASPIKATKKGKQKEYPITSPTKAMKNGKHNKYPTTAPSRKPGTGTTMPTKTPMLPPPTATNTDIPTIPSPTGANTDKPTGVSPTDTNSATPTEMPPTGTPSTDTDMLVVPVRFSMLIPAQNVLDPINLTALIQTLQYYLVAGMTQAYPNKTSVTVTLEASPNESDSNSADYAGSIVFLYTRKRVAVPSFENVQAMVQALMIDMAAVQAAVDGNPDIAPNQSELARVEQIIAGNMSAVALSSFTIVVLTSNASLFPVDQVQLTETLEEYLAAGMMEKDPNAVEVVLSGMTTNNGQSNTAVDYTGYVVFSDSTPPSFQDVQAWQQELMLDVTAVQAAVDGNPAIGQEAQVDQVTVDGAGGDVGTSTSVVPLSDFSIIVTSDDTNTLAEDQLSKTLEDYLTSGMMEEYPSGAVVTLDGSRTQIDGSDAFDYTGYVIISNATPPSASDVESLERDLMFDLTNIQAAVDSGSSIGQNVRVEQVVAGDDSVVALSNFTLVITSDDLNAVDRDQLAITLEDYLMTGLMQDFPDVEAVVLQHQPTQRIDSIFFSGYAMFAGSVPDFPDVQSQAQELLRDTRALQTAVDSNPAIGENVSVSGDESVGDDDDDDDINTAAIAVGVVAGFLFILILAAISMPRCRGKPGNTVGNNEESPLVASTPPPPKPPSGVASK